MPRSTADIIRHTGELADLVESDDVSLDRAPPEVTRAYKGLLAAEVMGSTWSYLDITALGRQEEWEDSPEGYPQNPPYEWWSWHDEAPQAGEDRPGLTQLRIAQAMAAEGAS
jgi:hypothetical protein